MADEPIREQLIDAVVTRLEAITDGTTYWTKPGGVGRDWKHYTDVQSFPFYGVIDGDEEPIEETNNEVTESFSVIIVAWIKNDADRRQALNRSVADIRRAIYADETWGGLADYTVPPSVVSDEASLVTAPFAYFELTMQIVYRHARTAA